MTLQSPRIYIYKITFEEVLYYYYGVHKEKKFGEYYMGSPVTHKWVWDFYTPKKQILEVFEYSDDGWRQAQEVEKRIIKPVYTTDKWCLNENCGGIVSLKIIRETGRKLGILCYENKIGIFSMSPQRRSEISKKNGLNIKNLQLGIHGRSKEQMSEDGKKGGSIGGKISKELGIGIHALTPKELSENGKKGGKISGKRNKELGIGIHSHTSEQKRKNGKKGLKIQKELGLGIYGLNEEDRKKQAAKTNSQKWMCLETGFVSTSGPLTRYQNKRGIDTSKRIRIS